MEDSEAAEHSHAEDDEEHNFGDIMVHQGNIMHGPYFHNVLCVVSQGSTRLSSLWDVYPILRRTCACGPCL